MTMAATAVYTVLSDREVEATFVPALLPKRSEYQVVFDLVWIDKAEHDSGEYPLTDLERDCVHDGETYIGRFGEKVCSACHCSLQWSPGWVKGGLYGSPMETFQWIVNTTHHHLSEVGVANGAMHTLCTNYDLLSEQALDSFYEIRGL